MKGVISIEGFGEGISGIGDGISNEGENAIDEVP